MSRKGMMYTIIVILLLLVIANIIFAQTWHHSTASEARVRTVSHFITDLEQDSQRAAYISGFRTFIAMEQYITTTGQPITSPEIVFREIFLNGTYANTSFIIMQNSTFNEYLSRVQLEAGKQGILFNATVTNVTLWQTDPWNVLVNYTLAANVTDQRGAANWTINETFTGKIPIVDLRDPLFTVRSYGRIQRVIRSSNVSEFVLDTGNANNTTNLIQHFNTSSYIARGRGPDMLMRFAGSINDSPYGIESLVDTDEFTTQNLVVNNGASIVDYEYFNNTRAVACSVQNLPVKFKFAAADIPQYEINELEYAACP